MIPEPQHSDSTGSQEFRPLSIANLACMVVMPIAVQFDSQLCARAIEIQHLIVERMLASKFVASKTSIPQVSPKNTFGLSRLLSQQSSAIHND
jgi:hypothetical protein